MSDIKLPELPDPWNGFLFNPGWKSWNQVVRGALNDPDVTIAFTAEQMQEYAKQAAEMEREEWYRRGLEQGLLSGKEREQQRLYRLVADDAWAITFQTFGQYRTALLKAIRGTT